MPPAKVYMAYRSNQPDAAKVRDAENDLKKNNIYVSQLEDWPNDQCQQAESSTEEGIYA